MILETERLILDTWQSTDWTAFRPIATDVEVMRYITGGVPWSDEQIRSFVDRQIELCRTQGFCRWKLLEKLDRNRSASVEWASGTAQRNPRSGGGWHGRVGAVAWQPKPPCRRCATPSNGCD